MTKITADERARLKQIRENAVVNTTKTVLTVQDKEDEWVLHNFCLYGKDEEVVPYLDAPIEWIREAFPNLLTCGAYFREIEKMLLLLKKLGKNNPKVVQFRGELNRYRSLVSAANLTVDDSLRKLGLTHYYLLDSNEWGNLQYRFGAEFSYGVKLTLQGLIARDSLDKETYDVLTMPWRKVFGLLTNQDREYIYMDDYSLMRVW